MLHKENLTALQMLVQPYHFLQINQFIQISTKTVNLENINQNNKKIINLCRIYLILKFIIIVHLILNKMKINKKKKKLLINLIWH